MTPKTNPRSAIRRAYREGRQAQPGAHNPYYGKPLQEHWSRGHRDRWLHGMGADVDQESRQHAWLLAAKVLIAAGASLIIYSFITAFNAQP